MRFLVLLTLLVSASVSLATQGGEYISQQGERTLILNPGDVYTVEVERQDLNSAIIVDYVDLMMKDVEESIGLFWGGDARSIYLEIEVTLGSPVGRTYELYILEVDTTREPGEQILTQVPVRIQIGSQR